MNILGYPNREQGFKQLGQAGGAPSASITYVYRDEYSTDGSAPLTTPTACEPGPGTRKVGDPNSKVSIASGIVQCASGGTNGTTFVVSNSSIAHAAGRCLKIASYTETSGSRCGWCSSNTSITVGGGAVKGMMGESADSYRDLNGAFIDLATGTGFSGTPHDYALVRNADGGIWVFQDAVLVWIDDVNNTAALFAATLVATGAGSVPHAEAARVVDLTGVWGNSHGLDTVNAANPTTGTLYSAATADGLHEITITLPGSPASGNQIELRFRVAGASDYDTAYIVWNTGTSQWDLKLSKFVGGSETQVGSTVANVGSGLTKIRVRIIGTSCTVWTRAASAWTRRINAATISNQNTTVGINATYNAGSVTAINSTPTASTTVTNGASTYASDLGF